MNTKTSMHRRAFTLIEIPVVIAIVAIFVSLVIPICRLAYTHNAHIVDQISAGKQIFNAMAGYSSEIGHDGNLPLYTDPNDKSTIVSTSNDTFEILLKGNYIDDKRVFINRASEWCKPKQEITDSTAKVVQSRESDWCYVRGLRNTSNPRWPLLANAFAEGTTTYVADPKKKGGVWKGTKAVVFYSGGNAEVTQTKQEGENYFIKRSDQPTKNAFVPEGDWLSGENIKLLYPRP